MKACAHVPESRHGSEWEYDDYAELIGGVGEGLDVAELAERLGRSQGAVRSAMSRLVPAGERTRRAKAERWLRERVAQGGFDWLAALEASYGGRGAVWTAADDAAIRAGWAASMSLTVLARHLRVAEVRVMVRLVKLGLAAGVVEVVDRLGCTPGGAVELRYRMAVSNSGLAVTVALVEVDGRLRLGLYGDVGAAADAVDELRAAYSADVRWRSAVRPCVPGLWTTATLRREDEIPG